MPIGMGGESSQSVRSGSHAKPEMPVRICDKIFLRLYRKRHTLEPVIE